jgi:hypothetical protein
MENAFDYSALPPTYLRCELIFKLDDYGKKESITPGLSGHGERTRAGGPLQRPQMAMTVRLSLFCFDRRRGRRTVSNYLNRDLAVLGPNEVRLLRRLGPYAPGGQRFQASLIELLTVANVQGP